MPELASVTADSAAAREVADATEAALRYVGGCLGGREGRVV
jgi:hypothetical protein